MPASDGQRGGHSPFAKAVLDADHGFFAEGLALNAAISKVSSTLKSTTKDQRMLIHGTADAIPEDFCIQPKAVFGPPHVLEVGMASEGGARGCNELAVFLEDNGFLPDVAARISQTMQVSVKHFLELKRGDIDIENGKLSFLERHHKKLLLALIDSTADSISSRDSADSDLIHTEQQVREQLLALNLLQSPQEMVHETTKIVPQQHSAREGVDYTAHTLKVITHRFVCVPLCVFECVCV